MDFAWHELTFILPEIFLLTAASLILVTDAYLPVHLRKLTYQLSQGTLLITALLALMLTPQSSVTALHEMFVNDRMGGALKVLIALVTFTVFLYSRPYLRERDMLKGEFFVLGLFAVLGMMIMVSGHHFLSIYLGLELLSLSLYAMVAMHRDSAQASEAAMKYFVLGAIASGMLLYGMSMIYGATASLNLRVIGEVIASGQADQTVLLFGLVFIIVGTAFKFGAVPFHMWVPDVYQGAPTPVTLFIASAPKLAAFAMLMRLLVDGMSGLASDWQNILIVLAVLSMGLGNLVAIAQTNIKRMFAYSTISHVGFLMLGVLTVSNSGYAASMFYAVVYTLMTLGGFGMILLLSRAGFEADTLDDFKGLGERHPWYAFIMMILMLAMAGVPPMLGFWAKWAVLSQVVQIGMIWLAIVGVLFSVIGAFFYLRLIKLMYFDKPIDNTPIHAAPDMHLALSVNGILVLLLGLFPQQLMEICLVALG
jgi:NADH-quinone oxidoreductase subunit N